MAKKKLAPIIDDEPVDASAPENTSSAPDAADLGFPPGQADPDPYTPEGRDELLEDDEAKPGELGYAKGASGEKIVEKKKVKTASKKKRK